MGAFLIVGMLTVLADFLTYTGLLWSGLEQMWIAKAVGFLSGMLFAYFANKNFTFGNVVPKSGSAVRFAMLYLATLTANVLINMLVLHLLAGFTSALTIAFVLATGCSATLNFIGMKFCVFHRVSARGLS